MSLHSEPLRRPTFLNGKHNVPIGTGILVERHQVENGRTDGEFFEDVDRITRLGEQGVVVIVVDDFDADGGGCGEVWRGTVGGEDDDVVARLGFVIKAGGRHYGVEDRIQEKRH